MPSRSHYMHALDPESPATMVASAAEQGRAAARSDALLAVPTIGLPPEGGGLAAGDMPRWLRSYPADAAALDVLSEADREAAYAAAREAYGTEAERLAEGARRAAG